MKMGDPFMVFLYLWSTWEGLGEGGICCGGKISKALRVNKGNK